MTKKKTYFSKHKLLILIPLICILLAASWLDAHADDQIIYQGLPAVPCFDTTLPIIQQYSLSLSIVVDNILSPLDANIGHDAGKCLRVIHTNQSGTTISVISNDTKHYTLNDFFNVWHKAVNVQGEMDINGSLVKVKSVTVNGIPSITYKTTPLKPNETIVVYYTSVQ